MISKAFAQGYDSAAEDIIGMGRKAAAKRYAFERKMAGECIGPEMIEFFMGYAEALGDSA